MRKRLRIGNLGDRIQENFNQSPTKGEAELTSVESKRERIFKFIHSQETKKI